MNKLSAQIDVLIEAKDAQNKKIDDLQSQLRDLQNQVSKPSGNYASADDVKQRATHVTASNEEDGFAKAIEMVLKKNGSG